MLSVNYKINDYIVIGDSILHIRDSRKIAISARKELRILRGDLVEKLLNAAGWFKCEDRNSIMMEREGIVKSIEEVIREILL